MPIHAKRLILRAETGVFGIWLLLILLGWFSKPLIFSRLDCCFQVKDQPQREAGLPSLGMVVELVA